MNQDQLKDKVELITGGASGMGYAAAELFLKKGAKVIIAGRRIAKGKKAVTELKEISSVIEFTQTDVSRDEEVKNLIEETVKKYGRLDIAFNNAGIEGNFSLIEETTEEGFDQLMSILRSIEPSPEIMFSYI